MSLCGLARFPLACSIYFEIHRTPRDRAINITERIDKQKFCVHVELVMSLIPCCMTRVSKKDNTRTEWNENEK